jgi:AmmeMemoRadiSam system protein B
MRDIAAILALAALPAGLLLDVGDGSMRQVADHVGFSTRPEQIEKVIELSVAAEKNELTRTLERSAKVKPIAVLSPHDDHLYAGRVYVHAIPRVAGARTVVIFGVTHAKARGILADPVDRIIFDDFEAWDGPYGSVKVDDGLRSHLKEKVPAGYQITSREGHAAEHSIEAMIPFLQHENRDVRIVPIMVTEMSFEKMNQVSASLAKALKGYIEENDLILGEDIAFVISADTVHYGPDVQYSPFGLDEAAHEKARTQDMEIGKEYLTGTISKSKLKGFTQKLWGEKITWCGRYSVPFGLLAVQKTVLFVTGGKLAGVPLRYSDSYTLGVLPMTKAGIGTTAPFSLEHWVGYWAMAFGTPQG